eukprot:TRINITY_DN95019_c0_g1_i1.p1 TRINITY_DN95019_c0_g1~~TRINITY_DN95019_c0_g1_i1.p1  ORF type:complete len:186 (-),score=43.18 TRINITY_DN95019_c0_g1_i1:284-841(-)
MPIEKGPPRNGDLPVLEEGEEIKFSETQTRLYTHQHCEGEGTLHLTNKRVVWMGGPGCAIDYPFITLHAVSRDKNAWPDPCLYCQLRGEESAGDEDDDGPGIPELRFVPAKPENLQQMFMVFSEMSALNPDPNEEEEDDSEEDEDLLAAMMAPPESQPELGVMWNADVNDEAMEDADEDADDVQM